MDKWIKKLSSAVIASVLALTLSGKAYADENAQQPQDDKPMQIEDNLIEDQEPGEGEGLGENDADGSGKEPGKGFASSGEENSGNTADINSASEEQSNDEDAASENEEESLFSAAPKALSDGLALDAVTDGAVSSGSSADTGDPTGAPAGSDTGTSAGTDASITVVDGSTTTIDPDEQKDVPKTTDNDGTGFWGYDTGDSEAVADDSLYMVDYQAESITAEDCDLTIEAAGLNQIGTINAEQNLTISGTGIMLVDKLTVKGINVNTYDSPSTIEGFFLKPLDGLEYSGSVAVFLQFGNNSPAAGSDSGIGGYYTLINGNVPGILDESYVLPENTHLFMPDGSEIKFVSPEISYTVTPGNAVYRQNDVVSSSLTIPDSSSLSVGQSAAIEMSGKVHPGTAALDGSAVSTVMQTPVINAQGFLVGSGEIKGNGIVITDKAKSGTLPKLDDGIFRILSDIGEVKGSDLDDELYTYLEHNSIDGGFLSPADFETMKDKGPTDSTERWGIQYPVFSFNNDNKNLVYSYSSYPTPGNLTLFQFWLERGGMGGGDEITTTVTGSTGSGIIGGKHAGPIQLNANHSLILKVTDKNTYYHLSAYLDGNRIYKLGNTVTVRFDYPAPTADGQLFAVFRNEDGSLTAFPARYDAITGQFVFNGDKLGNFVVVCINYEGKLYTKEFYDFLETLESVKELKYGL